jgi:hypothetical protein
LYCTPTIRAAPPPVPASTVAVTVPTGFAAQLRCVPGLMVAVVARVRFFGFLLRRARRGAAQREEQWRRGVRSGGGAA